MENKRKPIIFVVILLISIAGIIMKDKILFNEETYTLTDSKDTSYENNKDLEEKSSKKKIKNNENNITGEKITVYVSGEVKKPGIVTLNQGDRLAMAVEKVGGTTKKADLNNINMAIKLKDEQHYIIPKKGEKTDVVENDIKNSQISNEESQKIKKSDNESLININTASIEELDKLPGVGESTANKIVNHRDENGEFKTIEEIKNVNGIGDKKFEEMKSLICVK